MEACRVQGQNGVSEIGNSHVKIRAKGKETSLWNRDTDGKDELGNEMDKNEKKKQGGEQDLNKSQEEKHEENFTKAVIKK